MCVVVVVVVATIPKKWEAISGGWLLCFAGSPVSLMFTYYRPLQVWELTANNIIMVSAIGNDGPLYG